MLIAERLRLLMAERHLSQSELARRVGVTQTTVRKLTSGSGQGSKHLHRIARELGTSPAYLTGEVDDPDEGAPPPLPAPTVQHLTMSVALPSEAALARSFEGVLAASPRLHGAELARELAKRLPTMLGVLKGPLIEASEDPRGPALEPADTPATAHREPRRASRI